MHVLHTGCFLLELVLEDRVIHKVHSCHASNHIGMWLICLVVSMASDSPGGIHYRRADDGINVVKSWVPTPVLVESVRLVLSTASITFLLPWLSDLLSCRAVGIYLIWVILLSHWLIALSPHLRYAALADHRAAMLRVCVHDLLVHCVLTRGNHRALLGNISCLLVQAILLLNHWQVRVLSTCCVRRNLLVRL
jgi:hypothetical protein